MQITPFLVTKKEFARALGGSLDLVRRCMFAEAHSIPAADGKPWVITVIQGGRGRETRLDYQSCCRAYDRIRNGELPPLLPSAVQSRAITR